MDSTAAHLTSMATLLSKLSVILVSLTLLEKRTPCMASSSWLWLNLQADREAPWLGLSRTACVFV